MIKTSKKNWLIGFLGLGIVATSSVGFIIANADQHPTLGEVSINEEYLIGTSFTVPEVSFTVNGNECTTDSVIVFPDGGQYNSSTVTLSQVGNYRIDYSCYVNETRYTESVDFYVYNSLYQVNNSILASAEYYENYAMAEYDGTTTKVSGLLVDLPSGSNFQFNEVIDLSKSTKLDNFVEFLIVPTKKNNADFEMLYFQLTDIHNADNYVRIVYRKRGPNSIYGLVDSYVKAGSAFQPMVGYEEAKNIIHINDNYGCPSGTSFCGCPRVDVDGNCNGLLKDGFTALSIDYSTKQLYTTSVGLSRMITDLDSTKFYTDLWNGFTTGEAYLSIYAGDYFGTNSAKLFIKDINGVDLSVNRLDDRTAPNLTVDFGEINSTALPDAVVGYSYPVFKAKALDSIDGETEVKTSVYYNYSSSNRSLCNIVNGRVNITRSGIYTIIYETSDASGNKTKQSYTFVAKTSVEEMTASLLGVLPQTVEIGEIVTLPALTAEGYIQSFQTNVRVTRGQENIEIKQNTFIPKALGVFNVTYTVKDFVGREVPLSYIITVQDSGKPVFYEKAVFPRTLISGKAYNYPMLEAYDYSSDNMGEIVSVKRYITDKDVRREITGDTFTAVVENSGDTVLLEYVAENSQGEKTIVPYSIPCYIVEGESGLDISKYFIKNGDVSITPEASETFFRTTQDYSGFTFVSPLLADDFELKFNIDLLNNGFSSFNVYLTDTENEKAQIKVAYENAGDYACVRINDSANTFGLASSYENKMLMSLTFNAFVNTITTEYNDSIILPITTTLQGEMFDGFPSGKVYLRCEFEGVTTSAGVAIKRISGQPIALITEDAIRPMITVLDEYKEQYALNSTLTLYRTLALDVLDPEVTFTMSVRAPDRRTYLKDVNTGLELKNVPVDEYTITLSKYGEYAIIYKAVDSSGNSLPLTVSLLVFDNVKPEITVNGNIPSTIKVGTTITLPGATATDNLDGELDSVYIYVQAPSGTIALYVGSSLTNYSFLPKEKGIYVVKYCAMDASGNFAIINLEIKVS